jgi:hypothetical protein
VSVGTRAFNCHLKAHVGYQDELFKKPAFKDYSLRITEPTLCDPDVQQYSGYLDITDGKHLFFWCVLSLKLRIFCFDMSTGSSSRGSIR